MNQNCLYRMLIFLMILCLGSRAIAQSEINLSGTWNIEYTDQKQRIVKQPIRLPGSMLTNDMGHDVTIDTRWTGSLYDSSFYFHPALERFRVAGDVKFPFFLTPQKEYVGKACYRRTVEVPRDWRNRIVILHLERPHIETTLFINGCEVGHDASLSVPHEYEVSSLLRYGERNEIAIEVYNGIENVCVGQDSHSVSDQTQGNWNGVAGRLALISRPRRHIRRVQVYPRLEASAVDVAVWVAGGKGKQTLDFEIDGHSYRRKVHLASDSLQRLDFRLPIEGELRLWDEFSPNLYTLTSVWGQDTLRTTFGMREIAVKGRQIYLNGHPIWLRGTLDCCCFPLTGYPPTDVESWMQVFRRCKEYGLNHIRFHSYCPPEAAFEAADCLGLYLQPEGPSWPNHGVKLGVGMSIDRYLLEETERMVQAYGNHPSFCFLAAGNEPSGKWVQWCADFVEYWHQTGDTRRLYCGASVGGGWDWDAASDYHVKGGGRGLDWKRQAPQSVDDYYDQIEHPRYFRPTEEKPVNDAPIVTHEQGQWCAFPDLNETSQYTGPYKAGNFELFAHLLRQNGMAERAEKFLMASGQLQRTAYKYEIERHLRTRDYAGFQLLGLNDYSGQGSALVGVLNVFWREKGYCTAADWTEFCAPLVPLARFPRFVYRQSDTLQVPVEFYNAYHEALKEAKVEMRILCEGETLMSRTTAFDVIPMGRNFELGRVEWPLSAIAQASKLALEVKVTSVNAPEARNHWEFWVYPSIAEKENTDGIWLTDTLDARALEVLERGGKVLIEAAGKVRYGSDVKQNYLPVFWNTSWFKMRPPHTTGAAIEREHPMFRHFPTDDWANLQWWELLNGAQVMNLGELPAEYQPPIQPIDTWHLSRKLGMLIEARVLKGRLLMTTMDLSSHLDKRLVARQMRASLLDYMHDDQAFQPRWTLEPWQINNLFEKEAPAVELYTRESPDELKPKVTTLP